MTQLSDVYYLTRSPKIHPLWWCSVCLWWNVGAVLPVFTSIDQDLCCHDFIFLNYRLYISPTEVDPGHRIAFLMIPLYTLLALFYCLDTLQPFESHRYAIVRKFYGFKIIANRRTCNSLPINSWLWSLKEWYDGLKMQIEYPSLIFL